MQSGPRHPLQQLGLKPTGFFRVKSPCLTTCQSLKIEQCTTLRSFLREIGGNICPKLSQVTRRLSVSASPTNWFGASSALSTGTSALDGGHPHATLPSDKP